MSKFVPKREAAQGGSNDIIPALASVEYKRGIEKPVDPWVFP